MTALTRDLMPILRLFFHEQRGKILAGMALAAATVLAGIALLGLSGWFITATAIAGLTVASALAFDVFAPAAAIRFLAIARTACRYGERLVTHDATLATLAALRERLFRSSADARSAQSLLRRPATLLFRLTQDVDALDSLYLRVLVPAAAALGAALVIAIALGLMQLWLGLLAALFLLVAGLGIPIIAARAAYRPARRRAHAMEILRARSIDLVQGQTELIMTGRLSAQRAAVENADRKLAQADDALNRIDTAVTAGFGTASAVLLAGTLLAATALVASGTISQPLAAFALLIVLAAVEPFAALRRGALELGRTLLAARRIGPRLAPVAPTPTTPLPPDDVALRLDGVSIRREGAPHPAIRDISIEVKRGTHLAVVGPSGAGKSTLMGLIAGEITAETGRTETVAATLLTQRTELFADTLRDNLRLADPRADDARLLEALTAAGLGAYVAALPDGLDTRLGEGGLGLSGGEARRLALARLFLRDTPLWLLDEPTEGLDAATARDVIARLKGNARGRTLLIATHIRREAELADRLLILDRGRVIQLLTRGEPGFDAALSRLRPD